MDKKLLKKLPNSSGVYFFKKGKKILYIGKATSLRSRVLSYFSDDIILKRSSHIRNMVTEASDVEVKEVSSALEALLLEAQLIKKFQPYYNSREKDDKSFNHVVITKEEFPRIFTVRGKDLDEYVGKLVDSYGPFPNGGELKEALKIIRKIFPFRDKKSLIKNTARFNQQIGLEPKNLDKKGYNETIKNIRLLFLGKKTNILKSLKKKMEMLALEQKFEEARAVRDQIFALTHINDIALLKRRISNDYDAKSFRIEAYDVAHMSGKNTYGVMTVLQNGLLDKEEYRSFKIKGRGKDKSNDTLNLEETLVRRFGHNEWKHPDFIVVDGGLAQKNRAEKVIKQLGLQIRVVAVVKDERHRPKSILGDSILVKDYHTDILLVNSEAHRFSLKFHRRDIAKMLR